MIAARSYSCHFFIISHAYALVFHSASNLLQHNEFIINYFLINLVKQKTMETTTTTFNGNDIKCTQNYLITNLMLSTVLIFRARLPSSGFFFFLRPIHFACFRYSVFHSSWSRLDSIVWLCVASKRIVRKIAINSLNFRMIEKILKFPKSFKNIPKKNSTKSERWKDFVGMPELELSLDH